MSWLAGQTSDPAIAREVLALIAAHESDGAFLESPAVAFAETTAAPPAAPAGRPHHRPLRSRARDRPRRHGRRVSRARHAARPRRGPQGRQPRRHDAVGRARLQREARAAASLAHPGIATVYALEEDGDDCYLITEYLQGRTLRDELADGPLPYGRWRLVAIAIAEAVGAAHAQGLSIAISSPRT